jgi:hypothetical protein
MLYGARVDSPRAPVASSLSNTVPYRFSPDPKKGTLQDTNSSLFGQDIDSTVGAVFPADFDRFKVPDTEMRGEKVPQFGFRRKIQGRPDPG